MPASWPVIELRHPPGRITPQQGSVKEPAGQWQSDVTLLHRLLLNRGLRPDDLDFSLAGLPSPVQLVTDQVTDVLMVHRQRKVVVIADYDADGATACAVMVKGLRLLGFADVDYLVPDRAADGYGLTPALVLRAKALQASLIITVDNGITSFDGAQAARQLGVDLLITDHHLPAADLPVATAIVNPRLVPDFAAKELAGVGVAFYVLIALRLALRQIADPFAEVNLAQLLDWVALGTVADVVVLDDTNRALVEQGLRRIRSGQCSVGINALIKMAGREQSRINSSDLGFFIGPRLNAAGRLADMTLGIECLLATTDEQALTLAQALNEVNQERRFLEQTMQQEAEQQLHQLRNKPLPPVLCLFSSHWHEGVVGLLASRIKEQCHRPAFVFAEGQAPGVLKGSGRSIAGIHLRDVLADVQAQAPGLMIKFGGHAMAAGLSLYRDKLEVFQLYLQQAIGRRIAPDTFQQKVLVDGELTAHELTLPNAELLSLQIPWGQGFPAPLFHGRFVVTSSRVVGEKHLKLGLSALDDNSIVDAIHFNADPALLQGLHQQTVEAVYALESNFYRGVASPQLRITHLRKL